MADELQGTPTMLYSKKAFGQDIIEGDNVKDFIESCKTFFETNMPANWDYQTWRTYLFRFISNLFNFRIKNRKEFTNELISTIWK